MSLFVGLTDNKTQQKTYQLLSEKSLDQVISIGCAPENTLVIEGPLIQKRHVELTREQGRYIVTPIDGIVSIDNLNNQELSPENGRQELPRLPAMSVGGLSLCFVETSFSMDELDSLRALFDSYAGLVWPPVRPQLEAVLACAEADALYQLSNQPSPEDAQELWERLASRDLIPQEWLFSFSREFRLQGRMSVHPLSLQQASSLALDPQAILTAEALIPDLLYVFVPWGVTGAKHVVWSASEEWHGYTTPEDMLARCSLSLLSPYQMEWSSMSEISTFFAKQVPRVLVQLISTEWLWWCLGVRGARTIMDEWSSVQGELERLPKSTIGCSLQELPNPFEPLRRLAAMGVQVKHLAPDSSDIELCLIV